MISASEAELLGSVAQRGDGRNGEDATDRRGGELRMPTRVPAASVDEKSEIFAGMDEVERGELIPQCNFNQSLTTAVEFRRGNQRRRNFRG